LIQLSLLSSCQFWQFEHMLRLINRQEQKTGRLSSIRHIIDMTGYGMMSFINEVTHFPLISEINPFTMIFVSSGTLSYYSQLLHYDNCKDFKTKNIIISLKFRPGIGISY